MILGCSLSFVGFICFQLASNHRAVAQEANDANSTSAITPVAGSLISVPVQVRSAPASEAEMGVVPDPNAVAPPPQVTPAARMPQYQFKSTPVRDISPADSPTLRFLLTTPARVMLIEASVYVDEMSYRLIRERRIEEILSWMKQRPESVPAASETFTPPAGLQDRIDSYIASTGVQPSREELHWLLAQWVDGPTLLMLNDNFQRFRSEQQPLFHVLDRDRDGIISSEERTTAEATLLECDLNRDDVIESVEIAQVAADPRNWKPPAARRVKLINLPPTGESTEAADAGILLASIKSAYGVEFEAKVLGSLDSNSDGSLDSAECHALSANKPDLLIRVDFNTTQPDLSRLSVVDGAEEIRTAVEQLQASVATDQGILIPLEEIDLEVSAVQGAGGDQISVGAVNDGHAMLPEVDPNGDGRLTMRERRQLLDRLSKFDRDQNGSIQLAECRPVIRLCLGLGPYVHEPLGFVRNSGKQQTAEVVGPEWFQQMDKNRDNDVARREFPGTDDQFKALDADQDGLISAAEAAQSES